MLQPIRNTFCFTVKDESDAPFRGAAFAMERWKCLRCPNNQGCQEEQRRQECEACYAATSNECGQVVFCDLPTGDYVLKEVSVPDWAESNDKTFFSVLIRECGVVVDGSCEPFMLTYKAKFISDFGEDPKMARLVITPLDYKP